MSCPGQRNEANNSGMFCARSSAAVALLLCLCAVSIAPAGAAGAAAEVDSEQVKAIEARIKRFWIEPDGIPAGTRCGAEIVLLPGGQLLSFRVVDCDDYPALKRSLESTIPRAAPYPASSRPNASPAIRLELVSGEAENPAAVARNRELARIDSEAMKDRIGNAVRRYIVLPPGTPDDAYVLFDVTVLPDGKVANIQQVSSNGYDAWDAAVHRAIRRAEPLPVPSGESSHLLRMRFQAGPQPREATGKPAGITAGPRQLSDQELMDRANLPPAYPIESRSAREEGTTLIKLLVLEDGSPTSLQVELSSGYSRLDDAAIRAVEAWRFRPARRDGKPVESWLLVPITFRLDR